MTNPSTNLTDNPDVVALLLDQHKTVRGLMAAVTDAAPAQRAEPFESLVRLLAVHETSEEMVVYPALQRGAGERGEAIAEHRKAEEDEAKKVLADLEALDPASGEFMTMFAAFRADVEQHATAEELEVFPLLAQTSAAEELRALGGQVEVAQQLAPTHAHRSAPESKLGNMLVGPFVGMVDRVRDVFRDASATR